jgi:hypothetical protein
MPLIFDDQDNVNIAAAIAAGGNVWKNTLLNDVKVKIKDYYVDNNLPKCCYCSRLLVDEFRMVYDIEHILPQSKYSDLRFQEQNLNVACKRCNMEIKKARLDFIEDEAVMGTDYYQSRHYKFIHPNIDKYDDHLKIVSGRNGNVVFNKYVILSKEKGQFTYEYFELKEFEINNLNEAQGIKKLSILSRDIPDYLRNQIIKLLSKI